jgi:hypothetical protein
MQRSLIIGTKFFLALALLAASGCTITQEVSPAKQLSTTEVCIIENPAVRPGFLRAYKEALVNNGYQPRVLPANSNITACPVTSTYTARWSWDLAIYMSYAEINVFDGGKSSGKVLYDSRYGGGRIFEKFVQGDAKIKELVGQLFPRRT